MPVTLSEAKGLSRRAQRSFASLRMTARTPLQSAFGKPSLQTSAERTDQGQRAKRCGRMSVFGTSVRIARSVARMMREKRGTSVTDTQMKTDRAHAAHITALPLPVQAVIALLLHPS